MNPIPSSNNQHLRYHELDALRVLAFAVLIFYHIGMYYVFEWDWHIKSSTQSQGLQDVMVLTNQWRMSLLFLISSMVLCAILQKQYSGSNSNSRFRQWFSSLTLCGNKAKRLLVPLIFGMFTIVAPQVYIELTENDIIQMDFFSFYLQYINPNTQLLPKMHSPLGLLTWNHLWFLPYLFIYSILIILLFPFFTLLLKIQHRLADNLLLFSFCVLTATALIWLSMRQQFPVTHGLVDDWYNHAKYGLVCFVGIVLMMRPALRKKIVDCRRITLSLAVVLYCLIIADRHGLLGDIGGQMQSSKIFTLGIGYIVVSNHWCWLAAILGYASRYLSRPSSYIQYFNGGILPYYMLHQTIIVVCAYWLKPYALPTMLDFTLISLITVLGCLAIYEGVKKVFILRVLFGLKSNAKSVT